MTERDEEDFKNAKINVISMARIIYITKFYCCFQK